MPLSVFTMIFPPVKSYLYRLSPSHLCYISVLRSYHLLKFWPNRTSLLLPCKLLYITFICFVLFSAISLCPCDQNSVNKYDSCLLLNVVNGLSDLRN